MMYPGFLPMRSSVRGLKLLPVDAWPSPAPWGHGVSMEVDALASDFGAQATAKHVRCVNHYVG